MTEKRQRGRPKGTTKNRANADDLTSIITKIEQERNNFDARVANNLSKYYQMLEDIAFAKGSFKDAGIKDRKTVIEGLVKRAEAYAGKIDKQEKVLDVVEEAPKQESDNSVKTKSGEVLVVDFG